MSGLLGVLQIVLVVLKALGYITWPWLVVFLPLILSASLGILVLLFLLAAAIIAVKD